MAVCTNEGSAGAGAGTGLTLNAGNLDNDLLTGKAGGQTAKGGTAAGEILTLRGTSHANNDGTVVVTSANAVATTPVLTVESTAAGGYSYVSLKSNGAERGGLLADFGGTFRVYASGQLNFAGGGQATTPSIKVLTTGETIVQIGLYGSVASAGNFFINSTSHATKGLVGFGSNTGLVYDETNKTLGIGVAAGANTSPLTIVGTGGSSTIQCSNAASTGFVTWSGSVTSGGSTFLRAFGPTAVGTVLNNPQAGSADLAFNCVGTGAGRVYVNTAHDLTLGSNATERVRILSTGEFIHSSSVGIGKTPADLLDITGTTGGVAVTGSSTSGSSYYKVTAPGGAQALQVTAFGSAVASTLFGVNKASNIFLVGAPSTAMVLGTIGTTDLVLGVNTTAQLTLSGAGGLLTAVDALNLAVGSTTGTKIGTATSQKLGFFNATPVVQQNGTGNTHTVAAGSTTNVFTTTTFDGSVGATGYTVGDIVKALKNLGLLAS